MVIQVSYLFFGLIWLCKLIYLFFSVLVDSVFVRLPDLEKECGSKDYDVQKAFMIDLAEKMSDSVSNRLPKPMKLEFEKLMKPLLLIGKKMYVGQFIHPKPKTLFRGLTVVRRDSSMFARNCIETIMYSIMNMLKREDAKKKFDEKFGLSLVNEYLGENEKYEWLLNPFYKAMEEISNPDFDVRKLVRTIGKKASYKNEQILQKKLIDKIEKRTGTKLEVGERVPFVICLPNNGKRLRTDDDKISECGEDIEYALKTKMKVDRSYYVEKQFETPLMKYLEPLMGADATQMIEKRCREAIRKIDFQNDQGLQKLRF